MDVIEQRSKGVDRLAAASTRTCRRKTWSSSAPKSSDTTTRGERRMQVHFISDLHLSADRSALTAVFKRYLLRPRPPRRREPTSWAIFSNTGPVTTT